MIVYRAYSGYLTRLVMRKYWVQSQEAFYRLHVRILTYTEPAYVISFRGRHFWCQLWLGLCIRTSDSTHERVKIDLIYHKMYHKITRLCVHRPITRIVACGLVHKSLLSIICLCLLCVV